MKYAGVVEGFYGRPWSAEERTTLFAWMQEWGGLDTYLYAPKDDLKHRRQWRDLYSQKECAGLRSLIQSADAYGIRFIYSLSSGLDIEFSSLQDQKSLEAKLAQMIELGSKHFALLFDDIPEAMTPRDRAKFGSPAKAQSELVIRVQAFLEQQGLSSELLFCPTVYCDRQAGFDLAGNSYLKELGQSLPLSVDVLWTGPEVVSPEISPDNIHHLRQVLKRKPVIWDNLHANDYDMRRVFLGPYEGRPLELREAVNGILSNPNCELPLNELPLGSLAAYAKAVFKWDAKQDYRQRRKEWGRRFDHLFSEADLELLCDCFHLPMMMGLSARKLLGTEFGNPESLENLGAAQKRLAAMHEVIAGISNRPLFYALHRYIWDAYTTLGTVLHGSSGETGRPMLPDFLPKTSGGDFLRQIERKEMGPEGLEPPTK